MKKEKVKKQIKIRETIEFDQEDKYEEKEIKENDKEKLIYKNKEDTFEISFKIFNECDILYQKISENDLYFKKEDSIEGMIILLNKLDELVNLLDTAPTTDKEELFICLYNCCMYIYNFGRIIRKSTYSKLMVKYLENIINTVEKNVILLEPKYLEWRIKLYIELSKIYEENNSYKLADKIIETGLNLLINQKKMEEEIQKWPYYWEKIYNNSILNLKALNLKYGLLNNRITIDNWKKEISDNIKDPLFKNLIAIESCYICKNYNSFMEENDNFKIKNNILEFIFNLIKNNLETLCQQLIKINNFQLKKDNFDKLYEEYQGNKNDFLKEFKNENKDILNKEEIRNLSKILPMNYHIELIKIAYEIKNDNILNKLIEYANIRNNYKRIENPYIVDIDFIVSREIEVNIENDYELIELDLNESYLKQEIIKVRNKLKNKKLNVDKSKKLEILETKKEEKMKTFNELEFTKEEFDLTDHKFVYLSLKRSYSPKNAIYDIDIIIDSEKTGPVEYLKNKWKCISIPINQYTGIKATYLTVPYLCFKQTDNGLKNEEEKSKLLVDIKPMIGQSPLIRSEFGYKKLNVELRQVPKEFFSNHNMEYVFINIKNNENDYLDERKWEIINKFIVLNNSVNKNKIQNSEDEVKKSLKLDYDISILDSLNKTFSNCFKGNLGQKFIDEEFDFINSLLFLLWKDYIISQINQISHFQYLKICNEIPLESLKFYNNIINDNLKSIFINSLKIILKIFILQEFNPDIYFICKLCLNLTKLLEEKGDYKEASQFSYSVYEKIIDYKDSLLKKSLKFENDYLLPFSITASNYKIKDTFDKMKINYVYWKKKLERDIRKRKRLLNKKKLLTKEEEDEEEEEVNRLVDTIFNIKEKEISEKIKYTQLNDYDLMINSLLIDIFINYVRNDIKYCKKKAYEKNQKNNTLRNEKTEIEIMKNKYNLDLISHSLFNKINFLKGKNSKQIKENIELMNINLQNANIIEENKPKLKNYEQNLVSLVSKNPYQLVLLYVNFAQNRKKKWDKNSLIKEALKFVSQCEEEEAYFIHNSIENSQEIFSSLYEDNINNKTYNDVYPFNYLNNINFNEAKKIPDKPILIAKNSNNIILKFPYYKAKIPKLMILENPKKADIQSVALYGRISKENLEVSISNNELCNTGIRVSQGSIIKIPKLLSNEKYSFAIASYDAEEQLCNKIGKTLHNISTYHPLPINLLYNYIAKISYQLDIKDCARISALKGIFPFLKESKIIDNYFEDYLLKSEAFILKSDYNINFSWIDIQAAAESLLILTFCELEKLVYNNNEEEIVKNNQIILLKIINFLTLSCELSLTSNSFILTRRSILNSTNYLIPFLEVNNIPKVLLSTLIKLHSTIINIPKDFWDKELRILSNKISYFCVKGLISNDEYKLAKRIIISEIELKRRNFHTYTYLDKEEIIDNKKKNKNEQNNEFRDVLKRNFKKCFDIQNEYEEFLLNLTKDFKNIIDYFIEYYCENLNKLSSYVNNVDLINNFKKEILEIQEFFYILNDEPILSSKLESQYENSNKYLEFLCKIGDKLIENNSNNETLNNIINNFIYKEINEPKNEWSSNLKKYISNSYIVYKFKFEAFENDIEWNPKDLDKLKEDQQINGSGNEIAIKLYNEYYKIYSDIKNLKNDEFEDYCYYHNLISYLCLIRSQLILKNLDVEFEKNNFEFFYEINQLNINNIKKEDISDVNEDFIKKWEEIFELISQSIFYALQSYSYLIIQNCIIIIYNIIIKYNLNHNYFNNSKLWLYLMIIIESYLISLEELKYNEIFKSNFSKDFVPNSDYILRKNENTIKSSELNIYNKKIINSILDNKSIKFKSFSDVFGYSIVNWNYQNKNNLIISLIDKFIKFSNKEFSIRLLPFSILSYDNILNIINKNLTNKKEELDLRINKFDIWEKNYKKNNKNKTLNLNFIPQEKIDFENDKLLIEKQIEILEKKKEDKKNDKQQGEKLLEEMKNELNKNIQELHKIRELILLYMKEIKSNKDNWNSINSSRDIRYQINEKFENLIEILKKNYENHNLILTLNDYGDFNFSLGKKYYEKVEKIWKEGFDTIFSEYDSIKNFDQILEKGKKPEHFGLKETIIGIMILYKLSKYIYHNNNELKRLCYLIACKLCHSIFLRSICYPQNLESLINYDMKDFEDIIFENQRDVNPQTILIGLVYFIEVSFYYNSTIDVLPLIIFSEYLSNYILFSDFYSIKCKLLKIQILSNLGYIKEAINLFHLVKDYKGIPIKNIKESTYAKSKNCKKLELNTDEYFQNDLTIFDERNSKCIEKFKKLKIENKISFIKKFGLLNYNYFKLSKYILIFNLYKFENYDKFQNINNKYEKILNIIIKVKKLLKKIAYEDYFFGFKEYINNSDFDENKQNSWKSHLTNTLLKVDKKLENEGIEYYFKFKELNLSNKDFNLDRKKLIINIKYLLNNCYYSLNLFSDCYKTMNDSLNKLTYLSKNDWLVEKLYLDRLENDDKDNKEANNKQKNNKTKAKNTTEELSKKELNSILKQSIMKEYKKLEHNSFSNGLCSIDWIKNKYYLFKLMYYQNKYKEVIDNSKFIINECNKFNDVFYKKNIYYYVALSYYNIGDVSNCIDNFENALKIGLKNNHFDIDFISCIGDYGELLDEVNKKEESIEKFKLGKKLIYNQCNYLFFKFKNTNKNSINKDHFVTKDLMENKLDIEKQMGKDKIEKQAKFQKNDNKKNDKSIINIADIPVNYILEKPTENFKSNNLKFSRELIKDLSQNDNTSNSIIYNELLEYYIKFNLRIIKINLFKTDYLFEELIDNQKIEYFINILEESKKLYKENKYIFKKNFYININYKITSNYYYGIIIKRIALFNFLNFEYQIFEGYKNGKKNSMIRKLLKKIPNEDLVRNRYIINYPGFHHFLNNIFLTKLEKSNEILKNCLENMKEENIFFENNFNFEDILSEITEISLWMYEYRPRINFKFINNDDIRQYGKMKNKILKDQEIYDIIDKETEKKKKNLDIHLIKAYEYLSKSIEVKNLLNKIKYDYTKLKIDTSSKIKINLVDVTNMILESEKIIKNNKNNEDFRDSINEFDLLTFMNKLYKKSGIFTFSDNYVQKIILKCHKFSHMYINQYKTDFCIDSYNINPNLHSFNIQEEFENCFLIKSQKLKNKNCEKFIYILGNINQENAKIINNEIEIEQAEINKLFFSQNQILYGTLIINNGELKSILSSLQKLKNNLLISQTKSEDIQNRDFKQFNEEYICILDLFGQIFKKQNELFSLKSKSKKKKEEEEIDTLGHSYPFIPYLTIDILNNLIKIFDYSGNKIKDIQLSIVLRYFHSLKYN